MKPIKIDTQTYRIGPYVCFKTDSNSWKIGIPVDLEDISAGFIAGTVSYHTALKYAKRHVYLQMRKSNGQS